MNILKNCLAVKKQKKTNQKNAPRVFHAYDRAISSFLQEKWGRIIPRGIYPKIDLFGFFFNGSLEYVSVRV